MPSDYLDQLADFASGFKAAELPAHVLERVKWMVADCLAVTGAGMRVPEMRACVPVHMASAAPGNAWIVGAGQRSDALCAAFLNGIAGTWHELDEGHTLAKGHPAIQLFPAALAVAQEEEGVSGLELLAAITIGYEVSSRINRAGRIRGGIHPHGTFGVIGAALAVARIRRLPGRDFRRLINIAAGLPLASSYNSIQDGATVRNVFAGHSAFMGINAVRFTEAGFTGEADGVRTTFGVVLGDAFEPEVTLKALGTEWMTASGYFKLQPTARTIHPAIDALEDAVEKAPGKRIPAEQVSSIRVRTFGRAAQKTQKAVSTAFGAKFSIPFAVATFIVNGRATLDCFDDDDVANPLIQKLLGKVDLAEDPAMSARYPAEQPCTVEIELENGARYEGRCDVVRGEPRKPNVIGEIRAKFMNLSTPVWGEQRAAALFEDCIALDGIADVALWSNDFTL